jgi:hypothetical protein
MEGNNNQSPLKRQLNITMVKQLIILIFTDAANIKAYLQEYPVK